LNIKDLWAKCISNRVAVIGLIIFIFPLGLYCMWKGEHFSTPVRWVITVFMLWWAWNIVTDDTGQDFSIGGGCSAVFQSGGCTYYRDSNCNVISRVCE